jgi:hypothetical protein
MHKFQPRIHLVLVTAGNKIPVDITDLSNDEKKTFVFPETAFTAVTAYQNQLVSYRIFPFSYYCLIKIPEIQNAIFR